MGPIPNKFLCSVLLPTDTHHVLMFCNDPFRGVGRIDSKKSNICKIGSGQQQSEDAEDRNMYFIVAAAVIAVYSSESS